MLSMLGSVKVLVSKHDMRDYRGARVKRITVTAIEYISSDSRYTDSKISLEWLKRIFDPETKERANKKPRVLVYDGFRTYKTLEILEFYFENNILLCPYRDQVDRLDPVRGRAFTLKNIKAGFAASGLFPFNLDRVLRSMPAPLAKPAIPRADEVKEDRIQLLTTINNEAKVRRSTKSLVLGKAKVMSYKDLKETRAKRLVKEST
ncbi:hypothetical protein G7Y89_g7281 [Cudoniella acicularis]|uniref:DDE-1 domain-containing protein n=1 Tax=Cudoniella acicularis TaxID=354080 RepID=A0A8H4W4Q3_9HELO|nr:hypothetical protein G7Y89_g7281 [Cudoniella acicularis]